MLIDLIICCSEFCSMVRRIFICSSQDVKKMNCGSKLPISSVEDGTVISSDTTETWNFLTFFLVVLRLFVSTQMLILLLVASIVCGKEVGLFGLGKFHVIRCETLANCNLICRDTTRH